MSCASREGLRKCRERPRRVRIVGTNRRKKGGGEVPRGEPNLSEKNRLVNNLSEDAKKGGEKKVCRERKWIA